jgi:CDP-4-dehydro-6-deoxyglucose reductase
VHQAVLDDFPDLADFDVYTSGPPVMVDAAWESFPRHHLDPTHHYSDAFEFAYETGADTI